MALSTFNALLTAWIALAFLLIPIQLKATAPYGRHSSTRWGPMMDNRLGWVIMEIVSPMMLLYFFLNGPNEKTTPMWFLIGLWALHYLNRSLIYPLRTRTTGKQIPAAIVLSAVFFNVVNGWSNGYFLGTLTKPLPGEWFQSLNFRLGLALFLLGAVINLWSDEQLLRLRAPGENVYKIPAGGLFRYLSCPNHFGEIIEWFGFALMAWNLPALGFAIWTAANLIPRAISHHRWYRQHFPEYPTERKAVIPFVL